MLLATLGITSVAHGSGSTRRGLLPRALRCEQRENPLAVAPGFPPRLSWQLEALDGARGKRQTGYRIEVATRPELLGTGKPDLWDTGQVRSAEQLGVEYAGKPIPPGVRAHWRVQVWDEAERVGPSSAVSWWETGLGPRDWKASWITADQPDARSDQERFQDRPAPLIRRSFRLSKPISRARAHVAGLGYYEMRLNGRKVGDHVLDPGWTDYRRRVLYSTYDVTSQLQVGENAVGVMLGSGWWDPLPLPLFNRFNLRDVLAVGLPQVLLQLEVEHTDGSRTALVSDGSWEWAPGPILRNSVYLGEVYDARRELTGWDTAMRPGAGVWKPVRLASGELGPLEPQSAPPIRKTRTVSVVRVTELSPGVQIHDLGQNFAGWVQIRVQGTPGAQVHLRFGELLNADGTLNPMTSVTGQIKNSRASQAVGGPALAVQTDTYILRGGSEEVWQPRFTFHGFRYVEVTVKGQARLLALEGHRLNSDLQRVGEFLCSNPMFNRI